MFYITFVIMSVMISCIAIGTWVKISWDNADVERMRKAFKSEN